MQLVGEKLTPHSLLSCTLSSKWMFINIKSLLLLPCFMSLKELQDAISYYHVTVRMPAHVFLTFHPLILFPCQYPFPNTSNTANMRLLLRICFQRALLWRCYRGSGTNNFLCINPSQTNRHLHKLGVKSYKHEFGWYLQIQFEENQPHDCLALNPCTEWNILGASDNHFPLFSDAS